jgi:response regulator RpfG family c-di-GMP phosphodiesterase
MNEMIKVLYVDDEPINLMLFKTMLRKKYDIITAESGFNGLEELSLNPDIKIVISDMKMPGMNGLEFIKAAKKKYPNIVFCILTGYEITDEIMQALETSLIYQYFQKPFKVLEIEDAIKGALKDLVK